MVTALIPPKNAFAHQGNFGLEDRPGKLGGVEVSYLNLLAAQDTTDEEKRRLLPWLDSPNVAIVAAVANTLGQSSDGEITASLLKAMDAPEASRAFAIARSMFAGRGEVGGVTRLAQKLVDDRTEAEERRDLAFLLLQVEATELIPAYLDLLDDPDWRIRYNAIGRLKGITGDALGYDYRQTPAESHDAVARWLSWWNDRRASFWFPGRASDNRAQIGILLEHHEGLIRVSAVFPGSSAKAQRDSSAVCNVSVG